MSRHLLDLLGDVVEAAEVQRLRSASPPARPDRTGWHTVCGQLLPAGGTFSLSAHCHGTVELARAQPVVRLDVGHDPDQPIGAVVHLERQPDGAIWAAALVNPAGARLVSDGRCYLSAVVRGPTTVDRSETQFTQWQDVRAGKLTAVTITDRPRAALGRSHVAPIDVRYSATGLPLAWEPAWRHTLTRAHARLRRRDNPAELEIEIVPDPAAEWAERHDHDAAVSSAPAFDPTRWHRRTYPDAIRVVR